jgi:hypothetical protein
VLQVKIVYLPLPVQHLPLFVMQLGNPHNSIAVKVIFESVSLSPNVYRVFATLSQLVHR